MRLLDHAADALAPVRAVVITHSHDDRMGGLRVLAGRGIGSYALALTRTRAREAGAPVPEHALPEQGSVQLVGLDVEVFYPGHGHAPDNIVVYLPAQRVLFGGCMVRALSRTISASRCGAVSGPRRSRRRASPTR